MATAGRPLIAFDFDNTLYDNDRFKSTLDLELRFVIGKRRTERFWEIYRDVRKTQGFVDYPHTVERWAKEGKESAEPIMNFLNQRDFSKYIFPGAAEAVKHANTLGRAAIISDGDETFQRHKIVSCSRLVQEVEWRVHVVPNKELFMADFQRQYQAPYLVAVDDKNDVLNNLASRGQNVVTVHVNQGHYSHKLLRNFEPHIRIQTIGNFVEIKAERLAAALGKTKAKSSPTRQLSADESTPSV